MIEALKVDLVKKTDEVVEISIIGRISTNNAEECYTAIEDSIKGKEDIKLIIDCGKLEYISSAGLRTLLKIAKEMKHKLTIYDATNDVYDIFETTGMVKIFDVYRTIQEIDLEGCKKLGEGVTGAVYMINDELIAKIYRPFVTLEMAHKEKIASKESFLRGVPTAIPFEIVKKDGCYGVKYELMNGLTLGHAFNNMPDQFDDLATKYVNLIKEIKEIKVEEGIFPTMKSIVVEYLSNVKDFLLDEDFTLLMDLLEALPDQNRFVHGDMHPGNIMLQNGELLIIDMADVATGWEFYDLTQVYNDIDFSLHLPGFTETVEGTMGMKKELLEKVWEAFISKYYETEDKEIIAAKIEDIKLASSPIIVSRIGALPDSYREGLAGLMKVEVIDNIIKPNIDRIKEIYANNEL